MIRFVISWIISSFLLCIFAFLYSIAVTWAISALSVILRLHRILLLRVILCRQLREWSFQRWNRTFGLRFSISVFINFRHVSFSSWRTAFLAASNTSSRRSAGSFLAHFMTDTLGRWRGRIYISLFVVLVCILSFGFHFGTIVLHIAFTVTPFRSWCGLFVFFIRLYLCFYRCLQHSFEIYLYLIALPFHFCFLMFLYLLPAYPHQQ